jgi:hypothetical protein
MAVDRTAQFTTHAFPSSARCTLFIPGTIRQ